MPTHSSNCYVMLCSLLVSSVIMSIFYTTWRKSYACLILMHTRILHVTELISGRCWCSD